MGAASALGAVGGLVSGAGTIYSGVKTESESRRQAQQLEAESRTAAELKAEEGRKFGARQEMSYLKSGVLLTGSPLLVLADTANKNLADQKNIIDSGEARGQSLRRQGREAFVSSLFQGTSQFMGAAGKVGGIK